MEFINLKFLCHLIWAIPLVIVLFFVASGRRKRILKNILGSRFNNPLYVLLSYKRRVVRLIIFSVAITLLAIAAARPFWGNELLPYSGKGRDILIALDVSRSMLAKDVQPSRFEHAKWMIGKIIANIDDDRFGLIAFAGQAFLECPLTTDKTSFSHILNDMDTGSIPVGGTNIQNALKEALEAFEAAESGHRAIVLITDGDELQGDSSKLIKKLEKKGVPLFVIGVGDPSKPGLIRVPEENGKGYKFLVDSKGNAVESRLNEGQLRKLAGDDGIYIRSTSVDTGLNALMSRIKELIPKEFEEGQQTRPIERFYYPIGAALLLLLIWISLTERNRNSVNSAITTSSNASLIIFVFMIFTTLLSAQDKLISKPVPENTPKLDEVHGEDSKDEPVATSPAEAFNSGLEMQQADKEEFKKEYEKAINLADKNSDIRMRAYQNIGVDLHNKARNSVEESKDLATQDIDKAIKKIDSSLIEYKSSEDMYCEALLQNRSGNSELIHNQQLLLKDRDAAEELKVKFEELKKKLEEAQKKAQEAMKKQQEKNKKQQQKDGKDSKDSKKDGDNAKQATKDATKASRELGEKAEELNNQQLKNAADKATEELKKAQEAQSEDRGEEAEEHLKKALKNLGKDKESENDKKGDKGENGKDQNSEDKDKDKQDENKDSKGDPNKDEKLKENPEDKAKQGVAGEEKDIDPAQAEALLNMMTDQEDKDLRKILKAKMRKNMKAKDSDKNW